MVLRGLPIREMKPSAQQIFKVAVVQTNSGADRDANLAFARDAIGAAAAAGAQVVCFPEHMDVIPRVVEPQHVDTIPGMESALLADAARNYGVWIHWGSIYEAVEGSALPANTSAVISPDGQVLAPYRKVHLFDITLADGALSGESSEVTAGESMQVLETPFGTWGFAICYDVRFPELFRSMALAGAQVMFVPANFTDETGNAHWETLLRARAIENGCYVVATGQCGQKPQFKAHGHSMIIDPWGSVITQAGGEEPEIIYADIDLAEVERVRAKLPSLQHLRPNVYDYVIPAATDR